MKKSKIDKEVRVEGLLEIKRFEHDTDKANRSAQFLNGEFLGFGLECPNLKNAPFISRIDAGEYVARKVFSQKRGKFWLLDDVNGRTEIIINHSGSTLRNIKTGKKNFRGCTGLGLEIGDINGQRAIFETRWMCSEFMKMTEFLDILKVIIT